MSELDSTSNPCQDIKEIFRPVVGFEGLYEVSNLGNVANLNFRGARRVLKGSNNKGYKMAHISKDKVSHALLIHRMVAMAFIPNPDNKPHVNHIDGSRNNNCVDNLEWCTHKENIQHAWRIGLCKPRYGADHPMFGREVGEEFREYCRNKEWFNRRIINTVTGVVYKSIREAAEVEGLNYTQVRHFLSRKTRHDFTLAYYDATVIKLETNELKKAVNG